MHTSIPRIFLVGPMGAGKTTIGRRLAQVLRREFLDSDQDIEQHAGASIPLIFEMEGEAGFRAREKTAIAELTQRANIVLATGGGAVLDPDNRRCLAGRGFVVYLRASVNEQLRRTRSDDNRPLLQTADPRARLAQLFEQRDPLYREVADLIVASDGQSPRTVVQYILESLGLQDVTC
ncbi:MAG TPA: shikimate kinase AroK [Candidatus Competibacteraceae bacterium]|nr:MAG: shikimate kinase AroK [Candidatus Competibacteraceae bacterium]HOB61716.1 shikimate kinase AroK [Candidatus Competibacteraceae bacterium]HQA27513.1 shikimate kinase AroK [Candidatus Competibacteraceae bacterium]HQD55773.1 shikimate kinase AroK [Candidatus Competibacteraceae bacterium]